MSCEVFNENDFGMIEGCAQTFTVNLYTILGDEYKNAVIDRADWRLSKYGETELIVSKNNIDDSIIIDENIITISIQSQDTQGLHGKFTHQLVLTDGLGRQFIADLGKITIKAQIK